MCAFLRLVCAFLRLVASSCVLWGSNKMRTGDAAGSLVYIGLRMCPVFLAPCGLDGEFADRVEVNTESIIRNHCRPLRVRVKTGKSTGTVEL